MGSGRRERMEGGEYEGFLGQKQGLCLVQCSDLEYNSFESEVQCFDPREKRGYAKVREEKYTYSASA